MKDYMNPMSKDWMRNQVAVYNAISLLVENNYLTPQEASEKYEDQLYTIVASMACKLQKVEKEENDVN